MTRINKLLLIIIVLISINKTNGQGTTCSNADIFCTEIPFFTFPAGVNQPSMGNIGCLASTPNPKWYKMQVASSGNINIHLFSNPLHDIDFICWGPFDSLPEGCALINITGGMNHGPTSGPCPTTFGGYPIGNIVDCSYDPSSTEYIHIQNAVAGKWYIMLITNFSNQPCDIHLQSDTTCSTGWTDCAGLYQPPVGDTVCEGQNAFLYADSIPDCTYQWSGPNDFFTVSQNATLMLPNVNSSMNGVYTMNVIAPNGHPSSAKFCTLNVKERPTTPNVNLITWDNSINLFKTIFSRSTDAIDTIEIICKNDTTENIISKNSYPIFSNSIIIPENYSCESFALNYIDTNGGKSLSSIFHTPLIINSITPQTVGNKVNFTPYSGINFNNSSYHLMRRTNNQSWTSVANINYNNSITYLYDPTPFKNDTVFYQIKQSLDNSINEVESNGSLEIHSFVYSNIANINYNSQNNILETNISTIQVFPNPAQDKIYFNFDNIKILNYKITIFDISGKTVLQKHIENRLNCSINIETLENGIYFIECNGENIYRGKFVKNNK